MTDCSAQNSPHYFIETYPQPLEAELFNGNRFYVCRSCGKALRVNLKDVSG